MAADGLHGTVQPGSGMLLLMSGSTLEPGNNLEGGMELGNKKEMSVASL